ncbi:hypothetical protein AVEN_1199-1, partial [Araneus ventricosus]
IQNDRTIAEAEHEYIADDSITGYSKNSELVNARNQLHRLSAVETDGLPYSIKLKCGILYMVTANIDVEDGLVNGAVGILRHIELNIGEKEEERKSNKTKLVGLWIEFPSIYIYRSTWTPVHLRTATINISGAVKCKRKFPMVPAGAITVHKSRSMT